MDLKDLQKQILEKVEPLRIRGLFKNRKETLKEFLISFLSNWNKTKETIFAESGELQTPAGKRRSLGDIYRVCRYYYNRCTLRQVVEILYDLVDDDDGLDGMRSSYCFTINKRVFYHEDDEENGLFNEDKKDEYGMIVEDYLNLV